MDALTRDKLEHAHQLLEEALLADAGVEVRVSPSPPLPPEGFNRTAAAPPRKICWGKRVSPEFKSGVLWIEEKLKLNPDFLMPCINFETGGTFSPSAHNPLSSATGLIQFMDGTVASMVQHYPQLSSMAPNRKAHDLAGFTAVQQLSWVYYYFLGFGKDLSHWTLEDTYMAILLPSMIGQPLDTPMKWSDSAYRVNAGLDVNHDKTVTKREATLKIRSLYAMGMTQEFYG